MPLASKLWLPESVRLDTHECHGCNRTFSKADFFRHVKRCDGLDRQQAEHEEQQREPLAQFDEEQVNWLRKDADERGIDRISHGPRSHPRRRAKRQKGIAGHAP